VWSGWADFQNGVLSRYTHTKWKAVETRTPMDIEPARAPSEETLIGPRDLTSQRLSAITGKKQELTDGPATFEIRMSLRGIRERITSTDALNEFA